jgi:uncharacterized membrane protein (UPF0127 family)
MKKHSILISIIIVCVALLGLYFLTENGSKEENISKDKGEAMLVGDKKIKVEIADTEEERTLGLSGRNSLCAGCGMLFSFAQRGKYSFWMKDMNFDLDMLWIDGSRVIQIDKNIPHAGGTSEIRFPQAPVDKVLEINAGKSDDLGIRIGDEAKF